MWFLAVPSWNDLCPVALQLLAYVTLAVLILSDLCRVALEVLAYVVFGDAYLERPLSSGSINLVLCGFWRCQFGATSFEWLWKSWLRWFLAVPTWSDPFPVALNFVVYVGLWWCQFETTLFEWL